MIWIYCIVTDGITEVNYLMLDWVTFRADTTLSFTLIWAMGVDLLSRIRSLATIL